MRQRQKSLDRLLQVNNQLHQLEEARLLETQRKKLAADEEQVRLFGMLGDEKNDAFLLGLACRQIRNSDARARELGLAEQEQKQALMQRAAQKKALEKIARANALASARDVEKRELLDLGERLAGKLSSSLP
jgi:hypothetical protein